MTIEVKSFNWSRSETEDFVRRMRLYDSREVLGETGLQGHSLATAIENDVLDTWSRDGQALEVRMDGVPCAVFAACRDSAMAGSGEIWMMSAREIETHKTAFARLSLKCFRELCAKLPEIREFHNWIQETNARGDTREWLEWMGATFSETEKWRSPWTGETFQKFLLPSCERGAQCQSCYMPAPHYH